MAVAFARPMRRFLSFLMASAILLAGLALGVFEIVRAEGIRPYLLIGAGLMIGAAGAWLLDEFVRSRRHRWTTMNLGKVVADYGDVLSKPSDLGLVRDINSLPHLKSEIRAALKAVLAVTTNATMREHLKIAYISLAEFQPLSHREMLALRAWNIGVAEAAASKLQSVSDVALQIQQRVASESKALKEDLEDSGLW